MQIGKLDAILRPRLLRPPRYCGPISSGGCIVKNGNGSATAVEEIQIRNGHADRKAGCYIAPTIIKTTSVLWSNFIWGLHCEERKRKRNGSGGDPDSERACRSESWMLYCAHDY